MIRKITNSNQSQSIYAIMIAFDSDSLGWKTKIALKFELNNEVTVKTHYIFKVDVAERFLNTEVEIKLLRQKDGTDIAILV